MTDSHLIIEKILEEDDSPVKQMQLPDSPSSKHLVIDMGNGTKKSIRVNSQDDPNLLAQKFCFDNNLDTKVIPILAKNIRSFISHSRVASSRVTDNDLSIISATPKSRSRANTSVESVFDRLYKEAQLENKEEKQDRKYGKKEDKENDNPNKSLNKSLNKQPLINNGVLIYQRNTRLTEQNRRKIQKRIQQLKLQESSQLTFQPQINPVSRVIVDRKRQLLSSSQMQPSSTRHQKSLQQKRQLQKQQLSKCTFRPQTNRPRSSCSMAATSTDRFSSLYEDSVKRAARREQIKSVYEESFDFRPKVDKVSEEIVNGVRFEERMRVYERNRREAHGKEYAVEKENTNKPKTGRAPSSRNKQGLSIGLYLYSHRFERDNTIKKIQASLITPTVKASMESTLMYQSAKLNSFATIFSMLDDDGDGMITSTHINISCMDGGVLKLISPLLNQMQQLSACLTQQQFIQSLDRLFKTLSPLQRNILLHPKPKPHLESSTFQPSLNQKSMEIAGREIVVPGVELYESEKERKRQRDRRMESIRQIREKEQMTQCTFKPQLIGKRKRGRGMQ